MKLTSLFEITFSDAPQVDRDAGVIRGVRILGRISRNGREYSDAALRQAARLYEGLGVNLNHPDRPQSPGARDVEDGFGWLESIDIRADGVYGDLHYFRAHPQADVIVEAAVRNPRRFGLSHHAEGAVVNRHGKRVVESIETVRSVDLVQNPATNNGLFEGETAIVNRTIQEILQEAGGGLAEAISARELASAVGQVVSLSESADRDEQIETAMQTLLVHLLEDDHLALEARLHQASRLLEAHLLESDSAANPTNSTTLAEILERVERMEIEARCRALLESANRACDASRLEELVAQSTDEDRARLIESWPPREQGRAPRPRPSVSRPLYEAQQTAVKFPEDLRTFVAAIR